MTASTSARMGYVLVRALARFLLNLFYTGIEVVGAEHVPTAGPLIVAANHHNSVVDAMLLLTVIRRPLHILANAPLFRHPLIGPFLRLIGALPVHRREEAGDDPSRNAALFAATTAALRAGGAILIFPEGRTQPEPVLQAIRTGTARMLLAAESEAPGHPRVTLLPVGLLFHQPGTLLVEELWRENDGAPPPDEPARIARLQGAMRIYRSLLQSAPDRVAALRGELEAFDAELEKAGLAAVHLSRAYSVVVVARFALSEGLSLFLGAPLALFGVAAHVLPYQLTAAAVRLLPHTDEEDATDKIAAGLVLFPLAWSAEAYAVFAVGGGLALAIFLAVLLPTGFFALAWRGRLERVNQEARAFARFVRDRDLPRRLRQRRQALATELQALVRLAPEAWPSSIARPTEPED